MFADTFLNDLIDTGQTPQSADMPKVPHLTCLEIYLWFSCMVRMVRMRISNTHQFI